MMIDPLTVVRPEINALKAYPAPNRSGFIKLDAMENPYSWPDALKAEWAKGLEAISINRYPDASAAQLINSIKAAESIPDTLDVMLGNGSDELIQMLMLTLNTPNAIVCAPEPSFVMYAMTATFVGMKYQGVPLNADFSLNLEAFLACIKEHNPALIFIAYPNNPTGNCFDEHAIEAIVQASQGLVVIDEAYYAFSNTSFLPKLTQFNNCLVMRTYSKSGLAGLRLGYLIGAPAWIEAINKVRMPYNINALTQYSVAFALQHKTVLDEQAKWLLMERNKLLSSLSDVHSLTLYPTDANFILMRLADIFDVDKIVKSLLQKKILVKNLHQSHPFLHQCLRVSIGMPDENTFFISALSDLLNA